MYPNQPGQPNPTNQPQPDLPQPQSGQIEQSGQPNQSYQFSPQFQPQTQVGFIDPYQQQQQSQPSQSQPTQPQPQPNQPPAQPEYLQTPGQAPVAPPNKKLILFGGIGLLVLLFGLGALIFSGGSSVDQITWSNLMSSQAQIPAITNKYNRDISSAQLQNSGATIQATWQTNNSKMTDTYKSIAGRAAKIPSSALNKKTKEALDTSKNAGNLDEDYRQTLIKQLKLVDKNTSTLLQGDISGKARNQLKYTKELAKISLDILSKP